MPWWNDFSVDPLDAPARDAVKAAPGFLTEAEEVDKRTKESVSKPGGFQTLLDGELFCWYLDIDGNASPDPDRGTKNLQLTKSPEGASGTRWRTIRLKTVVRTEHARRIMSDCGRNVPFYGWLLDIHAAEGPVDDVGLLPRRSEATSWVIEHDHRMVRGFASITIRSASEKWNDRFLSVDHNGRVFLSPTLTPGSLWRRNFD